jgi:hypothetical protein
MAQIGGGDFGVGSVRTATGLVAVLIATKYLVFRGQHTRVSTTRNPFFRLLLIGAICEICGLTFTNQSRTTARDEIVENLPREVLERSPC